MQYSFAVLATILAAVANVQASCTVRGHTIEDCCWGGGDNSDACARQKGGASGSELCQDGGVEVDNFCTTHGITYEDCKADCCEISTGWGTGCPG